MDSRAALSMTILIYTAHAGGQYWRRMLEQWRKDGHTVRETCAFDDTRYRRKKSRLGGLWLRVVTNVVFPLRVWMEVRFSKFKPNTVRVVVTSPFFLPFVVAWPRVGRKNIPTVNVLNDLYPDAFVHAGMLRRGSRLERLLRCGPRYCLKWCDATVFLGRHLKNYAESMYGPSSMGRVIPVCADANYNGMLAPSPIDTFGPIEN